MSKWTHRSLNGQGLRGLTVSLSSQELVNSSCQSTSLDSLRAYLPGSVGLAQVHRGERWLVSSFKLFNSLLFNSLLFTCCACQSVPRASQSPPRSLQLEISDELSLDGALGRRLERRLMRALGSGEERLELRCRLLRDAQRGLRLYQQGRAMGGLAAGVPLALRCRWRRGASARWHSLELDATTAPAMSALAPAALALEEQRLAEALDVLAEELIETLVRLKAR